MRCSKPSQNSSTQASVGRSSGRLGRGCLWAFGLLCLTGAVLRAGESATRPTTSRAASRPSAEDEALIRKLLDDATGRRKDTAMDRVLDGMRGSQVKLTRYFDPGNQTQKIQRQVLRDIDEAIEEARRSQRSKPGSSTTARSDKEQTAASRPASSQEASGERSPSGDSTKPKTDDKATRGQATSGPARTAGELRELRRGWGSLPPRDREEVLQGFDQDSLEKYREWIERYYRSLATPRNE